MGPPTTSNLLKPTQTVAFSNPKARFIALNSKTTEFGYGVVHLYRDHEKTEGIYPSLEAYEAVNGGTSAPSSTPPARATGGGSCDSNLVDEDALRTVAILAVPSYMTASDFMGYVGEETRVSASHFRMIRTGQPNRYMVLIRFRQAEKAKEFVMVYNGKAFNSMEVRLPSASPLPSCYISKTCLKPENCHVVFIKSIQFISPSSVAWNDGESFPGNTLNDPFFPTIIQPSLLL